ncbi:MAG: Eco57I restriction-modification methylase domain-containing protein, partial [Smithella sp.]
MTNEAKRILEDIISDFAPDKFIHFFRAKSRQFKELKENLTYYHDDDFAEGQKLGEIKFDGGDALIVCAFAAQKPLTERSGKKAQYDKAKKILKEQQIYTAGIFIFYDAEGNFRFSLVYPEFTADKKIWSNFRRFTYFVSSDKDATNKTFKQRIGDGDFSELQKIKDAFSVEKVTREFYEDIANWYFWAIEHSRFPKDAEAEENGRNISIIRLITRIIFIWFMRERGLVPKALFEEKTIRDILHDTTAETSTFYKAVLQNLFFATLSTRKEARQFRSEVRGHKGYNSDFGNQYVYRYHDLFKNPDDIKTYFGNVPFLNGGLFECLDDKPNGLYIDGFTSVKKNQPEVPNFLFFSVETKADLNAVYGTKNKTYKVMGLLDILRSFNFTIDENSPDDQEVALDPELLGRVFENLLASFNPETATTARKATGSYYTPRGIVDYMVSESLKAYFKTHLSSIGHSERSEESLDERLNKLFSTSSDENPFSKAESEKIVGLVESVKIVDPAVGSGAFPMGALHKMVFILNKVDPGNVLWKQAQIRAAGGITDPAIRRDTIKRIEEFFRGKNADYGRKLYLIQRCIYGVDIQQIAVEIAKLRFFIALLVDEKIEPQKDNWGIEPLPNLDFKIMQGNSLISSFMGVDFDADTDKTGAKTQTGFDFADADDGLIKAFEQKKIDFQNEPGAEKKKQFKDEIEDLLIQIFETRMKMQKADYFQALEDIERRNAVMPSASRVELIAKEKEKLSKKTGFDLENIEKQLREFTGKKKTKPFFPWRLYFAEVFEKGGFDIVIGNPPYVRQESIKAIKPDLEQAFAGFYCGTADLYTYFYKKGIELLGGGAHLCYIAPNKFMRASYGKNTRKILTEDVTPLQIIDFGDLPIFDATTYPSIILVEKKPYSAAVGCDPRSRRLTDNGLFGEQSLRVATFTDIAQIEKPEQTLKEIGFALSPGALRAEGWTLEKPEILALMEKLRKAGKPLGEYVQGRFYRGILTGLNEAFVIDEATRGKLIAEDPKSAELIKPWLRGRDIKKWKAEWAGLYIITIPSSANREWPWSKEKTEAKARQIFTKTYPAISKHLSQYEDKLQKRDDQGQFWWELR